MAKRRKKSANSFLLQGHQSCLASEPSGQAVPSDPSQLFWLCLLPPPLLPYTKHSTSQVGTLAAPEALHLLSALSLPSSSVISCSQFVGEGGPPLGSELYPETSFLCLPRPLCMCVCMGACTHTHLPYFLRLIHILLLSDTDNSISFHLLLKNFCKVVPVPNAP